MALALLFTPVLLVGIGGAIAKANLIQVLVNTFGNLNTLPPSSHFWGHQLHVMLADMRILAYSTLLLAPLISTLLIVYVGTLIARHARFLIWVSAFFQAGLWGLVLVLLFSVSYADVVTSHTAVAWYVDGQPQGGLSLGQAQYLSSQLFLSFSFGDIVPVMATMGAHLQPHIHPMGTGANARNVHYLTNLQRGTIAQIIQLEALTSHFYWVGVVSSFVGLFWSPARANRRQWEKRWRKLNPLNWHRH